MDGYEIYACGKHQEVLWIHGFQFHPLDVKYVSQISIYTSYYSIVHALITFYVCLLFDKWYFSLILGCCVLDFVVAHLDLLHSQIWYSSNLECLLFGVLFICSFQLITSTFTLMHQLYGLNHENHLKILMSAQTLIIFGQI